MSRRVWSFLEGTHGVLHQGGVALGGEQLIHFGQQTQGIEHANQGAHGHARMAFFKGDDGAGSHTRQKGQVTLVDLAGTACQGHALAQTGQGLTGQQGKWFDTHNWNINQIVNFSIDITINFIFAHWAIHADGGPAIGQLRSAPLWTCGTST